MWIWYYRTSNNLSYLSSSPRPQTLTPGSSLEDKRTLKREREDGRTSARGGEDGRRLGYHGNPSSRSSLATTVFDKVLWEEVKNNWPITFLFWFVFSYMKRFFLILKYFFCSLIKAQSLRSIIFVSNNQFLKS